MASKSDSTAQQSPLSSESSGSTSYRVGIIGCGRPLRTEGATGFGMAHRHAMGYAASPHTQLVALADISRENAEAFQEEHGGDAIYEDYRQMLAGADLNIVSVCVWPHLHAEMVLAASEARVQAIHCEKPIAPTFGEARRMLESCQRNGVQLTFNHQRRFAPPFSVARQLLREGAIGDLQRIEGRCPDLNDWGTHWFDMMHFYNDETPAEWVMGQIDTSEIRTIFGMAHETQGISHVRFQNGVEGLLMTSAAIEMGAAFRLLGSDGIIEFGPGREGGLRILNGHSSGWRDVNPEGTMHDLDAVQKGIVDLVEALKDGREPELSGNRAYRAAELTFATYESSRKRGRVNLPLEIDDSPLLAMLDAAKS
ncbi:MAG: Gfo/Idh/MocA family oxidoreductase [Caldilineaceae bacterium]|nr:Gfo/Idh/MocA family oxidoreductase [Caldilineaceae bacterium]